MYAQITTTLKDFANWVADPSNPVTWILVILLALISTSLLGPRIGWAIRWPFFFLNKIQWLLCNPLRWLFRTGEGKWTHGLFLALLWSFVIPIYWLTIHVLFTPVRFINAVYFNMLFSGR
jgi:hypothetical protein|tara:strand:- start:16970 stop:17329 length:360 start_codon:yes stop_codon:yes gene_type:complete